VRRELGDLRAREREPQPAGVLRHVRHARPRHPEGHALNWGAGFLPTVYQGTAFKPQGEPIDNLSRPKDVTEDRQRSQLDLLAKLNQKGAAKHPDEPDWAARVESYELAYRMQMAAPEVLDLSKETAETKRLYGLDNPKATHFAKQCLTARRLVEKGVRFVQIYSGGMENDLSWDGHNNIAKNHAGFAQETDQPIAALLEDLARRGLLESTLVIWGGEFGRLPIVQKGNAGRDHNPHAMTYWLAGGGVKGGASYGASDETRLQGGREQRQHQRLPRDRLAPDGAGAQEADVPAQRPRLPADRRGRNCGEGHPGVNTDKKQ
jgi:hypothetical protein